MARHTKGPYVCECGPKDISMEKRILLPTDFSKNARNAIRYALNNSRGRAVEVINGRKLYHFMKTISFQTFL